MTKPKGLPPLPEGAVYAGQLKDFSDQAIAGWVFDPNYVIKRWIQSTIWRGMSDKPNEISADWHLAVPESSALLPDDEK